MKKYLGIIGLIAVTIIWGGGFVASDMALETLTPFQIMTIRFLIATIFMGLLAGRRIGTIKMQELKKWIFTWNSIICGFCPSDHRTPVYDTLQERIFNCDQCGVRSVYRPGHL